MSAPQQTSEEAKGAALRAKAGFIEIQPGIFLHRSVIERRVKL